MDLSEGFPNQRFHKKSFIRKTMVNKIIKKLLRNQTTSALFFTQNLKEICEI